MTFFRSTSLAAIETALPSRNRLPGLILLLALVAHAHAADELKPAPVCAFLDFDKTPRSALLEARLLADSSATWVERGTIAKILEEQTLQAVFGPQGGPDRVRLGKLLKADLLVLVRPVRAAKEPTTEVVVSDTAGGLRLMVRSVAVTGDAEADVVRLRDAVAAGLKKHREAVREVVAVPPFASTNLGYENEHLKGAYAKLVEQTALSASGVVVVELEEAEAIARELKLADSGATVKRSAPLYILGEYRHEGRAPDVRVTLKLTATRNGVTVGDSQQHTVAAAEAPGVLNDLVAERLRSALRNEKIAPPAVEEEARQLAELSRSRQRVGDWADALALLEASLLLDPRQPELNADALLLLKLRMEEVIGRNTRDVEVLRRAAQLHRRGLEHMEALITSGARLPRYEGKEGVRGGRMFQSRFPFPLRPFAYAPYTPPALPPEIRELTDQLLQERREFCLRLLPTIIKQGSANEIQSMVMLSAWELPFEKRLEEYAQLLLRNQDAPAMAAAASGLLYVSPTEITVEDLPVYRKYLDRLEKEGNDKVRAAVQYARRNLPMLEGQIARFAAEAAERKRLADQAKNNPPATTPWQPRSPEEKARLLDEQLKGTPLRQIRLRTDTKDDEWILAHVRNVVAAGPRVDVFAAWGSFPSLAAKEKSARPKLGSGTGSNGPVFLVMKEKGLLRRIWEKPGAPTTFSAVCFDGRYVWAAVEDSRQAPELFVVDPVEEKVYEVTAADGLPQPPEEVVRDPRRPRLALLLSPIEPGRVCVAGGFGRAWVGAVRFDAASRKPHVQILHEARELPRQGEKGETIWQNRNIAFFPHYMYTLRSRSDGSGKSSTRILVGRSIAQLGINDNTAFFSSHPLALDPDTGVVDVLQEALPLSIRDTAAAYEGGLTVACQPTSTPGTAPLVRVVYPGNVRALPGSLNLKGGLKAESIAAVAISNQRLHIALKTPGGRFFASTLVSGSADGKDLRRVSENLIHIRNFAHSSHYGLVAWCDLFPGIALCEVAVKEN